MSARLFQERRQAGTRIRLFPQAEFLDPSEGPETVVLSQPAGSVGPGPQDDRMYALFPIGKRRSYGYREDETGEPGLYLPPWDGPIFPPPEPDAGGHFDHIPVGTPQFEVAHLYGSVRFTLDVWEGYFGHPIAWHFANHYQRMELSIIHSVDNAYMGYGFLETGADVTDQGIVRPFALNFDVVAHETGHAIIYSVVGIPAPEAMEGEYRGFHESAADLVAMISSLHFERTMDELLLNTAGNLYTFNRLNRIAELTRDSQIRLASNQRTLADFAAGWSDEHDLSQPLTGAMFDILVDIFHENLLDWDLIRPETEHFADQVEGRPELMPQLQELFDRAFERDPSGFKMALIDARDRMGFYLARTWSRIDAEYLNYVDVGAALLEVDEEATGGRYQRLIRRNLLRREIGITDVGPEIPEEGEEGASESHVHSARSAVPGDQTTSARSPLRPLGPRPLGAVAGRGSFRERWLTARQLRQSP